MSLLNICINNIFFLSFNTLIYIHLFKNVYANDLSGYDWSVLCKFQPNSYNCLKGFTSIGFYYDIKLDGCKSSNFGKCANNLNQFSKIKDCKETCRENGSKAIKIKMNAEVICRLQPDFGYCNEYHPMWYYDVSSRACRGFSYSGCGGNSNRFYSAQNCTAQCTHLIKY